MNEFLDEFSITPKQLEELIEKTVERVFLKFIKSEQITINFADEKRYVTMNELCKELNYSKQTFANWRKDKNKQFLINPYRKSFGKKYLYEIESIRKAIKTSGLMFGRSTPSTS